jgi:hypothetical protein
MKLHVPAKVDVKAVRQGTGLTQEEFAAKFAISLGTSVIGSGATVCRAARPWWS